MSPPSSVPAQDFRQKRAAVEIHHAGIFAAPLRAFELAQHRAPGRHHRGIARIDHVGKMRLGRQQCTRAPPWRSASTNSACCAASASAEGCCAPRQRAPDDAVGGNPAVVVGRADQHVGQHAGLGGDGPVGHAPHPAARMAARPAARLTPSGPRPSVLP